MARYQHTFPTFAKKRNYAVLFNNAEDKAKMAYNKDMGFRRFVAEWCADSAELLGWTLSDFYSAYQRGGYQLSLTF